MRRAFSLIIVINLLAMSAANAAVSDEDIQQLREQLAALSQRLDELAAENAELRKAQDGLATTGDIGEAVTGFAAPESAAPVESWSDRIRLDGDFRYRYERIEPEFSDTRTRSRIRTGRWQLGPVSLGLGGSASSRPARFRLPSC